MAGIGFELKRLFKDKGLIAKAKAGFYSVFVTIGPVIISVMVITGLYLLLEVIGMHKKDIDLVQATILYSFMFSVIFTSGYGMMLSRYLSDRLYMEIREDILPSLYGSLAVIILICGLSGFAFYFRSPLPLLYKTFAYLLFIELSVMFILNIYISAVKNYKIVTFCFLFSTMFSILIGYLIIKNQMMDMKSAVIFSFALCIAIINIVLAIEIQRFFKKKSTLYFNFMRYFVNHRFLFFTNLFYMMGIYIHNFVFWNIPRLNVTIQDTYIYAPSYDIPAFYSFLSIMPTMVVFVVRLETSFYEKYRNYFYLVNNGACYEDIEFARKEMFKVLIRELAYIMQIQLFFTLAAIIIGLKFLSNFGFTFEMVSLFSILALGYYCAIIMFVIMTLLLYFDSQDKAFLVAVTFCISSFFFSYISTFWKVYFYGLGFFIASGLSLVVSIIILILYMKNLEYHIFCKQVALVERRQGLLEKFIDRVNRIGRRSSDEI